MLDLKNFLGIVLWASFQVNNRYLVVDNDHKRGENAATEKHHNYDKEHKE